MSNNLSKRWIDRTIDANFSLHQALKKMDAIAGKLLIVLNDSKYEGLVSIGDIQRAILKNISFETLISQIIIEDKIIANENTKFDEIKSMMIEHRMEFCPVISKENDILNIHFWEDLFPNTDRKRFKSLELPVVIMAGGLGKRLEPLTKVLPKPLIPINDKSILEEIINRFLKYDCKQIHLSLNYKADFIKFYMKSLPLPAELFFYVEEIPLGTGGSLSLMKSINSTFFVTNCDILVDEDYSNILDFHRSNEHEITIVSAIKNYQIAYGTLETNECGILTKLCEKPELAFQINTGMYILEPHLLKEIPENQFFPLTNLIENLISSGRKVGVFPVQENSWVDIGEMHLLNRVLEKNN